ncbi:MAG: TIGR04282 family arsenosugar biosynthesis glycosyltransferase [Phycisphaerae bacterium]
MKPPAILVFAKCPQPGRVNTRLCPPLSPEMAADLHAACVAYTCQCLARAIPAQRFVVVSPDDSGARFSQLVGPDWVVWPQGDGNLGDRLDRNIHRALSMGHPKVLCLGADSPTTPPERLVDALEALNGHRVCLGPCKDGGIYLLGVAGGCPGLLEGIDWGGPTVAEGLRINAESTAGGAALLESWYDIDRADDLGPAARDLAARPADPIQARLWQALLAAEAMA